MYEKRELMWLYGLTSAHVGSGDNLSYVDLPIQREKHTGFPKIEASSLKGAIRHHVEKKTDTNTVESIFGKGSGEEDSSPSEVAFSDARILFFPVKSAKGIFAWVTCPMVIERFVQDCKLFGGFEELNLDCDKEAICTSDALKISVSKVMLEELVFESEDSTKEEAFKAWICQLMQKLFLPTELQEAAFKSRVIMIPNDDFKYFTMQATEVITRNRINSETGMADGGALFTEEYLPPESIMYSLMFLKREIEKMCVLKTHLNGNIIQIGGNATLGKGLFSVKFVKGAD